MAVSCSCSIHIAYLQIYKMENKGDALKSSKMKPFCVNPRRRREKLGIYEDSYLRLRLRGGLWTKSFAEFFSVDQKT